MFHGDFKITPRNMSSIWGLKVLGRLGYEKWYEIVSRQIHDSLHTPRHCGCLASRFRQIVPLLAFFNVSMFSFLLRALVYICIPPVCSFVQYSALFQPHVRDCSILTGQNRHNLPEPSYQFAQSVKFSMWIQALGSLIHGLESICKTQLPASYLPFRSLRSRPDY